MRTAGLLLGIVLDLAGTIWLLQGIGILPGSFMTGSPFWAVVGAICIALGMFLVFRSLGQRAR